MNKRILENKKILIIGLTNIGSRNEGYAKLYFPMGLAYISSVLQAEGFDCDCLDLQTETILNELTYNSWSLVKSLNLPQYDIVAFGGTFLDLVELRELSRKIQEINDCVFQIVGGNMATMIADIILSETNIDCVVMSEGEETIVELIHTLYRGEDWHQVKGLRFRGPNGDVLQSPFRKKIRNLDRIPFPDRDSWSFDNIHKKHFPWGKITVYVGISFLGISPGVKPSPCLSPSFGAHSAKETILSDVGRIENI